MKKKHFLLILFLSLLASTQAQWQLIHTGFDMDFSDVECISEDTVFLCGGSILKTTNGGHTWTEKYHRTTSTRYIEFADSKVGYAGYQSLLKTTDGGENWFELDISAYAMGDFEGIYLIDADTLYIYSFKKLFKSTDGGLSWEEKFSLTESAYGDEKITDVFFVDHVGYLAANYYLFKSVDYGETWEMRIGENDFFESTMGSGPKLFFQDKDNGKIYNITSERFFVTNNGFDSYEEFYLTNIGSFWNYELTFLSLEYGCLIVSDLLNPLSAFYITTDGGYTWQVSFTTELGYPLNAIDGSGDSTFYVPARNGKVYKTPFKPTNFTDQQAKEHVNIVPNPAKDVLNLRMTYPLEQLIIYDLLGNEIQRVATINTTEHQIDISKMKTGVYLLKLQTGNQTITHKFIKQ